MRSKQTLCRSLPSAVALGFVLVFGGCGTKSQVPVNGKVVYEDSGEPVKELAGFEVIFTSEKLHVSARATIQPDGTFQLGTSRENDGTLPGEYIVTLTQPTRQPERPNVGDRIVDQSYEDPAVTDLRAEVKKGDKNEFTFKLRRIAKKSN